ncbi:hypothetical protein J5N97_006341 [Dioscorea zingiberensis]|uniref:Pentatricopeptide repeat-containing protein n=1 Tax=Dioscorea zingiberensis TaxID=325984 RepID=A0A9D5DC14_9LILI|nr:hypothetical protein J5N97_006341 [Dioscorea zingiberensis]
MLSKFIRHSCSSSSSKPSRLTKKECISFIQRCNSMRQLKQIHCQILMSSLQHNKDIMEDILVFCTRPQSGDLYHAERVFETLSDPSLFANNLMIKSFTKDRQPEKAILLFKRMRKAGMSPDNFTFPLVFKALGELRTMAEGRKVHGFTVKTGFEFDPFVRSSLMDMYAEMGAIEATRALFDEMPERSVVSWNVLIASYIKCRKFEDAITAFLRMEKSGVELNEATLVTTLSACVSLGDLEMGKKVHGFMENRGIKGSIPLNNALLDMYTKCGCMSMARRLFNEIPSKDVISWTSIVSGYASSGLLEQAEKLIEEIPYKNAKEILPFLASLLGACRTNRNVQMVKKLEKRITELESSLVANRWEDVTEVRRRTKDQGIKKTPGCSSIEVNGIICEFLARDASYPEKTEIYSLLSSLSRAFHLEEEKEVDMRMIEMV